MSIENVNGDSIQSQIHSIAKSGNAGSRKGRIEILEQVSKLGKELLDAINSKDETLVEMEGSYEDLVKEMDDLQNEIDAAQNEADNANSYLENTDAKIAELEERLANGDDLTEEEMEELSKDLESYYTLRDAQANGARGASGKVKDLSGKLADKTPTLEKYNATLNDIAETMEGYAEAGDEVKQAAHDFGRPQMAENLEDNKTFWGTKGALKRNESAWISFGWKENNTEELVKRMGYKGMGDGAGGADMTYHDGTAGGYVAEYDVMQYGIGGKLRDLTAKTWSYGKTVNTGSNDMKQRAEALNEKRKVEPEGNNENT